MCQLSFVNFHNRNLNIQFAIAASYIGARTEKHKDGFGFRYGDDVWKTRHSAHTLIDYGRALAQAFPIGDSSPIMSHIRWGNLPKIDDEFAHPFKGDRLILAHNGTLTLKEGEMPKDITDSQFFLKELEKELGKKKTIVNSLQKTMERFYGKFAFLIWDTMTQRQYICRGKSAELNIAYLTNGVDVKLGYAINTSNETLFDAAIIARNNYEAMFPKQRVYFILKKDLLQENSIFIPEKFGIKRIGDLVENPAPPKKVEKQVNGRNWFWNGNKVEYPVVKSPSPDVKAVIEFMNRHSLRPTDMDAIFTEMTGQSIINMTPGTLSDFVKYAIPIISAKKVYRRRYKKTVGFMAFNMYEYIKMGIPYPWMLLDDPALRKLFGELEKKE